MTGKNQISGLVSQRIVLCKGSGGAAIAARQLAEIRQIPTLEISVVGFRQFIVKNIVILFNLLFRKVGEDFIWPSFLSRGTYLATPGDELHWVLCPEFNIKSVKEGGITIYMHDEWWCTGWEAYEALEPRFEYAPRLLPSLRLATRNLFAGIAKRQVSCVSSKTFFVAPSRYLAERCAMRGLPGVKFDACQADMFSAPVSHSLSSKNRSIEVMFYAPLNSWYRKGSDLTAAVAQVWAKSSDPQFSIMVGGYSVPRDVSLTSLTVFDNMPHSQLMAALENTRILLFLTRNDNLPNIVAEAIARGVKVITTPFSGAKEFPRGDVFVTSETDPLVLTALLKKILAEIAN